MKKRITLWLLTTFCLRYVSLADAQQPTENSPHRLSLVGESGYRALTKRHSGKVLRELGYIEGQNIVIEWRFAEGKVDRTS